MYGESKKLSIDNNIFLQYCLIILGMILSTLGINLYLAPAKLLSGGVAGICVILYKLFGINQGISSFLMNIPIFIIARKYFDNKFLLISFVNMLLFSLALGLTQDIAKYFPIDDTMLQCIYGGALTGIGMGLTFKARATAGGLDIIAAIMKRKYDIPMKNTFLFINFFVVCAGAFLFGAKLVMYTLITMYIISFTMDIGKDVKDNGYDVEEAKKLLKEAGCKDTDNDGILEKDGKKLSFDIITYSSRAELSDISTALQDKLKEVGIEIKDINIYEAVEDQLASGDFDICAYSWTTAPIGDPYYFLGYNYISDGDCNYGKYKNEEVDKLVKELAVEFNQDKRAELSNKIVQIGNDDVAFSYVAHLTKGYAMKSNVSGFRQTSSDYYELNKDMDIK